MEHDDPDSALTHAHGVVALDPLTFAFRTAVERLVAEVTLERASVVARAVLEAEPRVVDKCVEVVRSGRAPPETEAGVVRVLHRLARGELREKMVVLDKALDVVADVAFDGSRLVETREAALCMIHNVSNVPACASSVMARRDGVVSQVAALVEDEHGPAVLRERALGILTNVSCLGGEVTVRVFEVPGLVENLFRVVGVGRGGGGGESAEMRRYAWMCLGNLAMCWENANRLCLDADFVAFLVRKLDEVVSGGADSTGREAEHVVRTVANLLDLENPHSLATEPLMGSVSASLWSIIGDGCKPSRWDARVTGHAERGWVGVQRFYKGGSEARARGEAAAPPMYQGKGAWKV